MMRKWKWDRYDIEEFLLKGLGFWFFILYVTLVLLAGTLIVLVGWALVVQIIQGEISIF